MVLAMAERTKKQRAAAAREKEQPSDTPVVADSEKTDRLKEELDGLLDEIDDVLETNAEDFVKSYVQKGGQ